MVVNTSKLYINFLLFKTNQDYTHNRPFLPPSLTACLCFELNASSCETRQLLDLSNSLSSDLGSVCLFLLFCKSERKNTLGLFSSKFIRLMWYKAYFALRFRISWIKKVTAMKRKRGRDQSKWVPLTTWSSPSSIPRGRIDFHFYTFQKKV